jgi:hypothetical protein
MIFLASGKQVYFLYNKLIKCIIRIFCNGAMVDSDLVFERPTEMVLLYGEVVLLFPSLVDSTNLIMLSNNILIFVYNLINIMDFNKVTNIFISLPSS